MNQLSVTSICVRRVTDTKSVSCWLDCVQSITVVPLSVASFADKRSAYEGLREPLAVQIHDKARTLALRSSARPPRLTQSVMTKKQSCLPCAHGKLSRRTFLGHIRKTCSRKKCAWMYLTFPFKYCFARTVRRGFFFFGFSLTRGQQNK